MTEIADNTALQDRLKSLAADYARWRAEATDLFARARQPEASADDGLLLAVEETSITIDRGILLFEELKADTARANHEAGSQLEEVGDAIRILLLEITELGTRLYSLRSTGPAVDDDSLIQPPIDAPSAPDPSTAEAAEAADGKSAADSTP